MRTRLGKDPIQDWEKMKKYLKRQFLPPDYQDLVYKEYQNCKQFGDSIAVYTKKFYRLQSYLDFNVLEEYSILRYKNGLGWAIREMLCAQSFYYLSDLVLAAEAIEQLLEREKTMKWKPQTLQHSSTHDVKYLGVSATHTILQISAIRRKLLQLFHQRLGVVRENIFPICHQRVCQLIWHTS